MICFQKGDDINET